MTIFPIARFTWQVLRAAKRSKTPPTGRALRFVRSRRTKDGTFLTELVELGLLSHVTGTAAAPFEATYALTARGEHAAEFGECERPMRPRPAAPEAPARPKAVKTSKPVTRVKK